MSEFLAWLTTPCLPQARRLGYLREAIALRYRARRCFSDWAPHLGRSQDFLTRAAGHGGGTGLILGSGLLLDVPLATLAGRFDTLLLVDMVHLPEVRQRVRAYPHVHLLEGDVTGVISALHGLGRSATPADLAAVFALPPGLPGLPPVDWVASVNLFSQLPLLPLAWAERLCPALGESRLLAWQNGLLNGHLGWLGGLAPRGCLLADGRQEHLGPDGILEVMDYSPWLERLGVPDEQWSWQLAAGRELGRGARLEHLVQAWDW